MKRILIDMIRPCAAVLGISAVLVFASCGKGSGSADKAPPPAKIENAVKETALTTVTLSAQAEERLGIEVAKAEVRPMPGSLVLGGEIVSLPGKGVLIAAPAAGTVLAPEDADPPLPGRPVKKGQPVLRLLLLPPDKELIGAREDVAVKEEQYDVAKAKAERSKELLAVKATSEKAFEDVQVELARAEAALNAAKARLSLLSGTDLEGAADGLSTLVLGSPVDGVLQRLLVSPGQAVSPSTALFEVVSLKTVWVRVPVYAGDLADVDVGKPASVRSLGWKGDRETFPAKPVAGPPLSDPAAASSDLYYELGNARMDFRVGEKVVVTLVKRSAEGTLVIPWSAILYDFNGGTWVYVKTADHAYTRSRIEVSHVVEGYAAVTRGLAAGNEVVTAGAAEIFGTEFGVGK